MTLRSGSGDEVASSSSGPEGGKWGRLRVPATPAVEYGHMPLPLRKNMSVVTEWMLSKEIHHKFAQLCHCNGRKMKAAEELFDSHPSLAFPRYWKAMAKCKDKEKWRARAIAAQVPEEAALAIQSLNDAGRVMAVLFMANAEPGSVITEDEGAAIMIISGAYSIAVASCLGTSLRAPC